MEEIMTRKHTKKETRSHIRFPVLSHLNINVFVRILPYYRSEEFEAQLENFSAAGVALRLPKTILEKNFIYIQVTLPNRLCITSHGEVKYRQKVNNYEYRVGIQFLDLPRELKDILIFMGKDYVACENRIKHHKKISCSSGCAAYAVCTRHEKIYPQPSEK